jgi:hypothetical protein
MHDENGLVKRAGLPVLMRGPVACETSVGCAKGHWINKPDLTTSEDMVIDLFQSSISSGGQMLTELERNSDFLMEAFSELMQTQKYIERYERRAELLILMRQLMDR